MKTRFWIGVSLSLFSAVACAQYKYIGPDGKVVYSDTPPPANAKGVQKTNLGGSAVSAAASLPFVLQAPARNFPVTLYTAPSCGGCDSARTFLSSRGIPFSEKTVKTSDDAIVLKVETGATGLPVVVVGNSKQIGFDIAALGSALDAAGYPPTSQLPPSYKLPPPVAAAPEKPAADEAKAKSASVPTAAAPSPSAPAAPSGERPGWFKGF